MDWKNAACLEFAKMDEQDLSWNPSDVELVLDTHTLLWPGLLRRAVLQLCFLDPGDVPRFKPDVWMKLRAAGSSVLPSLVCFMCVRTCPEEFGRSQSFRRFWDICSAQWTEMFPVNSIPVCGVPARNNNSQLQSVFALEQTLLLLLLLLQK